MKKLYLDIDGVLLTTKQVRPADYIDEFIDYIITNFDCFWLTTHCKGNANVAIKYLSSFLNKEQIEKISKIKPTNWTTLKTEGIDFESDFIWLDDYPFIAEKNVLELHQCLHKLIVVDLKNGNDLKKIIEKLKNNQF